MSELAARITEGRTACSGCGAALNPYTTDTCVWCRQPLCSACYTESGSCGHPELDELRRREAARRLLLHQRTSNRWTLIRLAKFHGTTSERAGRLCKLWGLGRLSSSGQVARLSPEDVAHFGEAIEVLTLRRNPRVLYRPPWPEWVRVHWQRQGYTKATYPLKP